MTETKHTPGPWEISQEPPRWIIQAQAPVGKKAVAWMVGDYVECGANARLIASAPRLAAELAHANGALCDANERILKLEAALTALSRSDGFAYASLFDEKEARREFAKKAIKEAGGMAP